MHPFTRSFRSVSSVLTVFSVWTFLSAGICHADSNEAADSSAQVLTYGPVHEAFAEVEAYKPEPGIVVPKAPPDLIDEVPPDEKPEGDNVTWIPGYWGWDTDRSDFIWISGVWRALPPGRQWVSGYWGKAEVGYQWTSGYWAAATDSTVTYLPDPPATLENGPNAPAPSDDYIWVSGNWKWVDGRYAWSPGYWMLGQADWDWCPGYYVWTPHGDVFVDGYWDYSIERRGVLFAPVYCPPEVRSQPSYRYTPAVVIDLNVLPKHLFLRSSDHHYYFGDYYAAQYSNEGYEVDFAFQSKHLGYDPIFAHQLWDHRQEKGWQQKIETRYQDRRDHKNVRPPRTWVAQKNAPKKTFTAENPPIAMSFDQLSKAKDNQRGFQPVVSQDQQRFSARGKEVKTFRDGRRNLEARPMNPPAAKPGIKAAPATVAFPKSPIVSPSFNQNVRDRAPPRPQAAPRATPRICTVCRAATAPQVPNPKPNNGGGERGRKNQNN